MEESERNKRCRSSLDAINPTVIACLLLFAVGLGGEALPAQDLKGDAGTKAQTHILGRVVDENGRPIPAVSIAPMPLTAFLDTRELLKKSATKTDADGRFRVMVGDKFAGGMLFLASEGRQSLTLRIADAPGARWNVDFSDIVMVPGGQIIGRVRNSEGGNIAGARVSVQCAVGNRDPGQLTVQSGATSNAQGMFVVPCVPRTGLRLTVICPGYVGRSLLASHESPLDLTLQTAEVVRGQIVDREGRGVADVSLYLAMVGLAPPLAPATSGAEGYFAIDVPSGTRFRVRHHKLVPPFTQYSSDLLHGAASGVLVTPVSTPTDPSRTQKLRVQDTKTGALLPQVRVSWLGDTPENAQSALAFRSDAGSLLPGRCELEVPTWTKSLLVEAPGHAFAIAALHPNGEETVVNLDIECVLTGSVTDSATGAPLAGIPVRALPKGGSSGTNGVFPERLPRTDAAGRYHIGGLRPGNYLVQTHAPNRPAGQPEAVRLRSERMTTLDLVAPPIQRWPLTVTGKLDQRPAPMVGAKSWSPDRRGRVSSKGYFQHFLPIPPPRAIDAAGKYQLGPMPSSRGTLKLMLPSRIRSGCGTQIDVGLVSNNPSINLSTLRSTIVTGKVEIGGSGKGGPLPTERIAVAAYRVGGTGGRLSHREAPQLAGLTGTGSFTLDLLNARYRLQLVDLATGIVFHTESAEFEPSDTPLVLRPELHWLDTRLQRASSAGITPILVSHLDIQFAAHRDNAYLPRILGSGGDTASFPVAIGETLHHWLMPEGNVVIRARRTLASLDHRAVPSRYSTVAKQQVNVTGAAQSCVVEIPESPPSAREAGK